MSKIALLPGGFKPPHAGHYNMAKWLSKNTGADTTIIFVGPKERDGITQEMSLKLWKIYTQNDSGLEVRPAGVSPVRDVYDFIEQEAPEGSTVFLGMGEKDVSDTRFKNIPKFAEPKGITFETTLVPPQAGGVSGTEMRGFIKMNDKPLFQYSLPDHLSDEQKEQAWSIVTGLEEAVTKHESYKDLLDVNKTNGPFISHYRVDDFLINKTLGEELKGHTSLGIHDDPKISDGDIRRMFPKKAEEAKTKADEFVSRMRIRWNQARGSKEKGFARKKQRAVTPFDKMRAHGSPFDDNNTSSLFYSDEWNEKETAVKDEILSYPFMKEYDKKYIQDILTSSFRGTKKEFDDFINTKERFNEIIYNAELLSLKPLLKAINDFSKKENIEKINSEFKNTPEYKKIKDDTEIIRKVDKMVPKKFLGIVKTGMEHQDIDGELQYDYYRTGKFTPRSFNNVYDTDYPLKSVGGARQNTTIQSKGTTDQHIEDTQNFILNSFNTYYKSLDKETLMEVPFGYDPDTSKVSYKRTDKDVTSLSPEEEEAQRQREKEKAHKDFDDAVWANKLVKSPDIELWHGTDSAHPIDISNLKMVRSEIPGGGIHGSAESGLNCKGIYLALDKGNKRDIENVGINHAINYAYQSTFVGTDKNSGEWETQTGKDLYKFPYKLNKSLITRDKQYFYNILGIIYKVNISSDAKFYNDYDGCVSDQDLSSHVSQYENVERDGFPDIKVDLDAEKLGTIKLEDFDGLQTSRGQGKKPFNQDIPGAQFEESVVWNKDIITSFNPAEYIALNPLFVYDGENYDQIIIGSNKEEIHRKLDKIFKELETLEEDLYDPRDKYYDFAKTNDPEPKEPVEPAYKYKRRNFPFRSMYENKGKTLHAYDFDDTIARVKANIRVYITSPNGEYSKELLIPAEKFPEESKELEARLGNLEIEYDFKEFEKQIGDAIVNAGVVNKLKNSLSKPNIKTTILTARSIGHPVTKYLREELGLAAYVVPLGLQVGGKVTGQDKANWIEKHINKGYNTIYFIDDSEENRVAVAALQDKYPDIKLTVENPHEVSEMMMGMMTEPEKKKHNKAMKTLGKDLKKINKGDQYVKVPKSAQGTLTRKLHEISSAELDDIETYADAKLDPIDIEFTKHFFNRLNDPRNREEISSEELIGFFKRLSNNKKVFIDFLTTYKELVATDNRTNLNIPFVNQANKAIAKTVMRKSNFQTSNPKMSIEGSGWDGYTSKHPGNWDGKPSEKFKKKSFPTVGETTQVKKMKETKLFSKNWWKEQLVEVLTETKANTHLTHLEELVLTRGQDGFNKAKSFLYELIKNLKGESNTIKNVSVKWDGAPAIFTGINPDNGQFFVGTKSVFNKSPKINYTPKDIDENHGHAAGLAKKLKLALQYLPAIGIKGILQGDFMFDNDDVETSNIEGVTHYTFKPNTIRYAVEANSELGKQIIAARIGIIFHTTYKDLSGGGASFGANINGLSKSTNVWFDDAYFKDDTGILLSNQEEKFVLEKINEADSINVDYTNLPLKSLNTYINSEIRQGEFLNDPIKSFTQFKEWYKIAVDKSIEKVKRPETKEAKKLAGEKKLKEFESQKQDIINLFKVSKLLSEAKAIFITKYDKAVATKHFIDNGDGTLSVTKAEGFVAVDHTEDGIKLVDRLEFSKNNFNAGKPGAKK